LLQKLTTNITKYYIGLSAIILALGAGLRFVAVGQQELWYDEAYSGILVRQDWSTMLAMIREDVHPPLYYLILKIWSNIFGTSADALRLFSVACGLALLVIVIAWARLLFRGSKWKQLILLMLFAINPFFISYSVEARSYAFAALVFVAASYLIYRAGESRQLHYNKFWFGASVLLALMVLTHYALAFGILAVMLWVICQPQVRDGLRKELWRTARTLALISLPIISALAIWLPNLIYQFSKGGLGWIPRAELSLLPRSLYAFAYGVERHRLGVPPVNQTSLFIRPESLAMLLFIVFCALFTIAWIRIKQRKLLTFLALSTLLPVVLVILASWLNINMYVERYLIGYGALWIILFAYVLFQFRWHYSLIAVGAYCVSLIFIVQPIPRTDFAGIAKEVQQPSVQKIVISNPLAAAVLRYYLPDQLDSSLKVLDIADKERYFSWSILTPSRVVNTESELLQSDIYITETDKVVPAVLRTEKIGDYGDFTLYRII
jgi:uncharacterized membrane protein